jgi:hypothetical protein
MPSARKTKAHKKKPATQIAGFFYSVLADQAGLNFNATPSMQ